MAKEPPAPSTAPPPEPPRPRYLTMQNVAALLTVNEDTVLKWIKNGLPIGYAGCRLRLKGIKVGGGWRTTQEWVDEFIAAQNPERPEPWKPAKKVEPELDTEHEAAKARLDAIANRRKRTKTK